MAMTMERSRDVEMTIFSLSPLGPCLHTVPVSLFGSLELGSQGFPQGRGSLYRGDNTHTAPLLPGDKQVHV